MVAFPRLSYQGTKKFVGTRSAMHTFPIAYNLTEPTTLFCKYDSLSEPSLISPSKAVWLYGGDPLSWMPLKVAPRDRETFQQGQIFG